MYIFRAYQSPCSGTHCGDQWAQIPNLASRNHSGHRYWASDCHDGSNLPGVLSSARRLGTNTMTTNPKAMVIRIIELRSLDQMARRGTPARNTLEGESLAGKDFF